MGPRSKVLDTDGPTPKFLFAIIKQLDLKSIDWNKVASDLEISNGHAARMRYSRFRNQMEGPLRRRAPKKKNDKTGKGDPKADMQMHTTLQTTLQTTQQTTEQTTQHAEGVKMETMDSFFPANVPQRFESEDQKPSTSQEFSGAREHHPFFPGMPSHGMMLQSQMPQYMHSAMQFPMFPGIQTSMSSPPSSPMSFESSYPTVVSHDVSLQDFGIQPSAFPEAPVLTWDPPAQIQPEPPVIHIKDEPEIVEPKVKEEKDEVLVKAEKVEVKDS